MHLGCQNEPGFQNHGPIGPTWPLSDTKFVYQNPDICAPQIWEYLAQHRPTQPSEYPNIGPHKPNIGLTQTLTIANVTPLWPTWPLSDTKFVGHQNPSCPTYWEYLAQHRPTKTSIWPNVGPNIGPTWAPNGPTQAQDMKKIGFGNPVRFRNPDAEIFLFIIDVYMLYI